MPASRLRTNDARRGLTVACFNVGACDDGLKPILVRPRVCFVREVQVHPRRTDRPEAKGNCADREAAWGATGGERAIRRMTNSIRPRRLASPLGTGEAQTRASGKPSTLMDGAKAMRGAARWLETESLEGGTHEVERPARMQGEVCQVE